MLLKVLIVDDETGVLDLIRSLVKPLGCEVLTMSDSREAAERLENEKFDGILLDVHMPNLDGFELTKRVRTSALNREAPVVMLTGYDDLETMRKAFKAGATCFLGKPVNQERLYSLIRAMRGPMLKEKRRHARLPFRATVKCRVGPSFDDQFIATSSTISESGMLLESSGGLSADQEVIQEFAMPSAAKPLKVRGLVARTDTPNHLPVKFLNMEIKEREAIQSYIEGTVKL